MRATASMTAGAVAVLLCAVAAFADERDEGQRVRVELVNGALRQATFPAASRDALEAACGLRCRAFTGWLLEVREGTLTVSLDRQQSVILPAGSVARLQVSRGRWSRGSGAARGAGVGLAIGALLGGLSGYAAGGGDCVPHEQFDCMVEFSRGSTAAIGAVALGAIGLAVGAVAGAADPGEQWCSAADLAGEVRVSLTVGPTRRGGAAAAVAVAF